MRRARRAPTRRGMRRPRRAARSGCSTCSSRSASVSVSASPHGANRPRRPRPAAAVRRRPGAARPARPAARSTTPMPSDTAHSARYTASNRPGAKEPLRAMRPLHDRRVRAVARLPQFAREAPRLRLGHRCRRGPGTGGEGRAHAAGNGRAGADKGSGCGSWADHGAHHRARHAPKAARILAQPIRRPWAAARRAHHRAHLVQRHRGLRRDARLRRRAERMAIDHFEVQPQPAVAPCRRCSSAHSRSRQRGVRKPAWRRGSALPPSERSSRSSAAGVRPGQRERSPGPSPGRRSRRAPACRPGRACRRKARTAPASRSRA